MGVKAKYGFERVGKKANTYGAENIARSLGFDYASYFNNFFKKHTGLTPMALRKTL
jgi:AraC-like DNA-binding protein